MDTERDVVEQEILSEQSSIFSRESYVTALGEMTSRELIEECLKQYDLSGEMMGKYRLYWQKSEDYRKQRDEAWTEKRKLLSLLYQVSGVIHEAIERIGAIQHVSKESAGYTHNANVIVRRLIHGIAQNASDKLKAQLSSINFWSNQRLNDMDDIPF